VAQQEQEQRLHGPAAERTSLHGEFQQNLERRSAGGAETQGQAAQQLEMRCGATAKASEWHLVACSGVPAFAC